MYTIIGIAILVAVVLLSIWLIVKQDSVIAGNLPPVKNIPPMPPVKPPKREPEITVPKTYTAPVNPPVIAVAPPRGSAPSRKPSASTAYAAPYTQSRSSTYDNSSNDNLLLAVALSSSSDDSYTSRVDTSSSSSYDSCSSSRDYSSYSSDSSSSYSDSSSSCSSSSDY